MVGQRDRNLRQGDLAEQLGTLLLQGLAAVAPVPRTEDTGVDVVATLLRPDGKRHLLAEDSFYVQLKSASRKEVEYCDSEINWLRSLELPFLIGSVDLKASTLQLFATHELNRLIAEWAALGDFERLKLVLLPGGPTGFDDDGERRLHIGPPILAFGLSDLSDETFVDGAYSTLKGHLSFMRTNRVSAQAGFYRKIEWQTNGHPIQTLPSQSVGMPAALPQLLSDNWPVIHSWYFHLCARGHAVEAEQLSQLFSRMGQLGWEIPPAASLMKTFRAIADALPSHDWFDGRPLLIMDAGLRKQLPATPGIDVAPD